MNEDIDQRLAFYVASRVTGNPQEPFCERVKLLLSDAKVQQACNLVDTTLWKTISEALQETVSTPSNIK